MELIAASLIVFAITLVVTKSKILAGKREFVEKRYQASKTASHQPNFIHRWWHAMWTCPMCSGFWVAILISLPFYTYGWVWDLLIIFSLNWLIHCLENFLFQIGNFLEKELDGYPF